MEVPIKNREKGTIIFRAHAHAQDDCTYVLCRSQQRIPKDRAIRSKQEGRLRTDVDQLTQRVADKKLVKADKINQAIGRLKERYPHVARLLPDLP